MNNFHKLPNFFLLSKLNIFAVSISS